MRFPRGIRERQGADAVIAADQWRRPARDRADEMIELAAVRLGIALEKEMQRLVRDDALCPGKGEGAAHDAFGPQPAPPPATLPAMPLCAKAPAPLRGVPHRPP